MQTVQPVERQDARPTARFAIEDADPRARRNVLVQHEATMELEAAALLAARPGLIVTLVGRA